MKYTLLMMALLLMSLNIQAQAIKSNPSTLNYVTVYSQGAELNHSAKVSVPAGSSEIVIGNLSHSVDANSIQVGCNNELTILSVLYRQEFKEKAPRTAETAQLELSLEKEISEQKKITTQVQTYSQTLAILDANKEVAGANTGLNITELQKLVDYYLTKSQDLRSQINLLQDKEKKQNEIVARLQNQLQSLSNPASSSKGELVLQVLSNVNTSATFSISYVSPNASWQPLYDLKTNNTKSPLKIIYKANIVQQTGIDWNDVRLSISSSNPSQSGNAPILSTWFLNYLALAYGYNNSAYRNDLQSANSKEKDAMNIYGARPSAAEKRMEEKTVNSFTSNNENTLNVSFDIDLPYDIKSDGKAHSVSMKEYELPAIYKYYSAPRKDRDAFLMAEISEWEKLNLVPGEANIIFDGAYIGKSFIDPNATQDTLNLSLGRDKKVVVKREKLADFCSTKLIGTKRLHKISFEIKVKNTRKEAIDMLLKDQYPISQDKDIEVELEESSSATVNQETGILTWKLNIAPGETKKVRVSYSVKFPKDKPIGNLY